MELESQKVEPVGSRLVLSSERDYASLFKREFKSELFQSPPKRIVEGVGFVLILKRAHKIIGVADVTSLSSTIGLHYILKPQIERVVQVHITEDGRDNSALGRARSRMEHLSVCVEHSGLEPLLNKPQESAVSDPDR
jgi:hypothetical protein